MTARKYEFLTDGSEALIAQFVKEPSEEAALKVFNEVSRHNTLSSNELKNIAIDEIRKEIQTLATKDELKLTNDRLTDLQKQMTSMQGQMTTMTTKDELKATKEALQAEIKASSANMIKWVVSVQIATIASIIVILKFFLNH